MTTTTQWDEEFLKARERRERETARAERTDADWQTAGRQFEREKSDTVNGFERCRSPKCRRALRCVDDGLICRELLPGVESHVERELTEEIYAEIQIARCEAAMATTGQTGEADDGD